MNYDIIREIIVDGELIQRKRVEPSHTDLGRAVHNCKVYNDGIASRGFSDTTKYYVVRVDTFPNFYYVTTGKLCGPMVNSRD